MKYKHLTWDSKFFQKAIGRLDIEQGDSFLALGNVINSTKEDGLYIFVPLNLNEKYLNLMDSVGAVRYDIKLIYQKDHLEARNLSYQMETTMVMTPDILSLALLSGHCSRFKKDPVFNKYYAELYKRWLANSFDSPNAKVHTVLMDGEIAGFISISHSRQLGTIELLAVHPNFQHRGIAQNLLQSADNYFIKHHCQSAVVVTQQENIHACNLYEKNGFQLQTAFAIYHYWKK